jgi:hypothetical protein
MGSNAVTQSIARRRPVVVHYHLFKNAGSSIDSALKDNFGATWAERESNHRMRPAELASFLIDNPWICAFSSHTATLPVPPIEGIEILPIVMLRHPVDRIRSVYEFERKQKVDGIGPNTAKGMTMDAFVAWRLERFSEMRDRSFVNFQVERMALGSSEGTELERAMGTVAGLPFVGVVEAYEQSLERLEDHIQTLFPKVRLKAYRRNTSAPAKDTLEDRLRTFREQLGGDLYEKLMHANADDMVLWESACQRYQGSPPTADVAHGHPATASPAPGS